MRKLITLAVALMISSICFAQKDVTKFLGIPVDGTKSAMIQKLKDKGYTYNSRKDCLEGEFNGRNVEIHVVTNKDKVYRIAVVDAEGSNEASIKVRYNRLCRQFMYNDKYKSYKDSYEIPEDDDISYEMSVNNKRYEAAFYQVSYKENDSLSLMEYINNELNKKYSKDQIESMTEVELLNAKTTILFNYRIFVLPKKSVWFMIGREYGRYLIII